MAGFAHDIAGGGGNLIAVSVQSPDFVHGVSGWRISRSGVAEFQDVILPGGTGGITATFAATAPASPATGDLWYDTAAGLLLSQWDGSAWVPYQIGTGAIANGAVTASQIAANTITAGQLAAGIVYAGIIDSTTVNAVTFTGSVFEGADFIINSSGSFYYAGTPAAGNLSTSSVPGTAGGADAFGNQYLPGTSTYAATDATQLADGFVNFYTGSQAGGWTLKSTMQFTGIGIVLLSGGLITQNNTLDDGSGDANFLGDLIARNISASGTACQLSGGASTTIPMAAPSRTALGATWNSATAADCNQNFVNIINALGSAGIF
jgi:hypothetical protein